MLLAQSFVNILRRTLSTVQNFSDKRPDTPTLKELKQVLMKTIATLEQLPETLPLVDGSTSLSKDYEAHPRADEANDKLA